MTWLFGENGKKSEGKTRTKPPEPRMEGKFEVGLDLVGGNQSGKSQLRRRFYLDDEYDPGKWGEHTISNFPNNVRYDDAFVSVRVELQLQADSGLNRSDCQIICFDITSKKSFEIARNNLTYLICNRVTTRCSTVNAVLCGTMYDLIEENYAFIEKLLCAKFQDDSLVSEMVSFVGQPFTLKQEIEDFLGQPFTLKQEIEDFCEEQELCGSTFHFEFFKVSSYTGFNVTEVFERVIRLYYKNRPPTSGRIRARAVASR